MLAVVVLSPGVVIKRISKPNVSYSHLIILVVLW